MWVESSEELGAPSTPQHFGSQRLSWVVMAETFAFPFDSSVHFSGGSVSQAGSFVFAGFKEEAKRKTNKQQNGLGGRKPLS